jgi:hypothetical protein
LDFGWIDRFISEDIQFNFGFFLGVESFAWSLYGWKLGCSVLTLGVDLLQPLAEFFMVFPPCICVIFDENYPVMNMFTRTVVFSLPGIS